MMVDLYRLPRKHPRVCCTSAFQSWYAEACDEGEYLAYKRRLFFASGVVVDRSDPESLGLCFEVPLVLPINGCGNPYAEPRTEDRVFG